MTGDIHKIQIVLADELNFGSFEKAVVVLTDKTSILDGFLGQLPDVSFGADDPYVVRMAGMSLVGECDVLAYQHSYPDPGHVEPVEERLDVGVDLETLALALVLEDSLCNGGHDAIVPPLNADQSLCESSIVVLKFGGPIVCVV